MGGWLKSRGSTLRHTLPSRPSSKSTVCKKLIIKGAFCKASFFWGGLFFRKRNVKVFNWNGTCQGFAPCVHPTSSIVMFNKTQRISFSPALLTWKHISIPAYKFKYTSISTLSHSVIHSNHECVECGPGRLIKSFK